MWLRHPAVRSLVDDPENLTSSREQTFITFPLGYTKMEICHRNIKFPEVMLPVLAD